MEINRGIAGIQENRRKLFVGLDANKGFEQGLHDTAQDQYAGNCHFIYELLQNAEDAGASHVEFTLAEDSLEFRHDGKRLFNLNDVDSITGYHQSTKGQDYDAVGKFGMGFKSVFSCTQAPEIHSGDFHFRIRRMFYPDTENVRTDERLDGWTKFVFPFDLPKQSPKEICNKVRKGLSEIKGETLLFLKKIKEIECLFDGGTAYLHIVREECGHVIRIRMTDSARSLPDIYYLKFVQNTTSQSSNTGASASYEIAVAFGLSLRSDADRSRAVSQLSPEDFSIKPIAGQVFVYFPADREDSHLKFHINAPFATPMSRENLSDTNAGNDWLLGQLAELTVTSLPFLRDNQLLDVDTLGIFPTEDDHLPEKYKVFENRIIDAFINQPLTPTKSGGHKPARQLIRSENRMSELFSDEDMSALYPRFQAPVWAKAPMNNSREHKFLSRLQMEVFGDAELKKIVSVVEEELPNSRLGKKLTLRKNLLLNLQLANEYTIVNEPFDIPLAKSFVALVKSFSDDKLLRLYRKFSVFEFKDEYGRRGTMRFLPVFKANDECFYPSDELYLMPALSKCGDVGSVVGGVKFLKKIYDNSDEKLIAFFRRIGISDYAPDKFLEDMIVRDDLFLKDHEFNPADADRHIRNIQLLIASYKTDPRCLERFQEFLWIGKDTKGNAKLFPACEIIIDEPYESTGMRNLWPAYSNKYMLSEFYREMLSGQELRLLAEIFRKFDFVRDIKWSYIDKSGDFSVEGHPRHSELALPAGRKRRYPYYSDCDIENIDNLINAINDDVSKRLWKLVCRLKETDEASRHPFKAKCHYSDQCSRESDSLLVCHLQEKAWIKDVSGKWCRPADVSWETLHHQYEPREICPGLNVINFGSKTDKALLQDKTSQIAVSSIAKGLGCDSSELREMIELYLEAKKGGIDYRSLLKNEIRKAEMPEGCVRNTERRQTHVRDDYRDAPHQEYGMRLRSVRSSACAEMAQRAKARLERDYTDEEGKMRCQLCRQPMPFNKRDGKQFFECVQILRNMDKETPDQYLALCPCCAAVYDEWIRQYKENADALLNKIVVLQIADGQGSVAVPLPCRGTTYCPNSPLRGMGLYFTGTHFTDLQCIIKEAIRQKQ